MPKHRQHLLMRLIDGEREIHPEVLRRPARRLPLGREIQYRNLVGIGNIHENPRTQSFQLEALGMSLQWNVGDFLAAQRVNHRKRTAAIANPDAMQRTVDTDMSASSASSNDPADVRSSLRNRCTDPSPAFAT